MITIIGLIVGGIILFIVILFWILTYNKLIKSRNYIEESWGQIDVQLKRRYDLIPNLVETVKGYAAHEQGTLEKVIQARNMLAGNNDISRQELMEQNNQMSGALKSIFALGESYPDLKANTTFLNLQEEITNSENKISYARQLYNTCVVEYNNAREVFPSNIISSIHGFKKQNVLETVQEEKQNIKVSF